MTTSDSDAKTLIEALSSLLQGRKASTQEEIRSELEKLGFETNQSSISRLLRKVGAIKVVNTYGQAVYSLAREPAPPTLTTPLKDLILNITSNEVMVVILTSPGSASMVARLLDYNQESSEVLGTIAGDDTIFVMPKSVHNIKKLIAEIRELFRR